jgi:hypothetical protein
VKSISWRAQLGLVGAGYAAVLAVAATLLYGRHLAELKYPDEASGGMWAAGDLFLYIFIVCLLMIPTVFLVWVIAKFEFIYKTYSQLLLGLSLSAPVSLGLLTVGQNYVGQSVGGFCLLRLVWSPFILLGIGASRLVARFDRGKKLVSYALLIEGLTLATAVALYIHSWGGPRNH